MKMTFRWYGKDDPVSLKNISQIPLMDGIVSACYDVPVGKEWKEESINEIKAQSSAHNLSFEVVESVPVHEDIKLGKKARDEYIQVYRNNIKKLASAGVKVICYNFMPVFDWLRSNLSYENSDGSTSLIYREDEILNMDPKKGDLSLPGWDSSYTKDGLISLLDEYKNIDDEKLFENITYFIRGIMDVCEQYSVRMAIHPDDPPWSVFNLPRIIRDEKNLERFLRIHDSEANGLTLCTGSLGSDGKNNVVDMIRKFGKNKKIGFIHARNVKVIGEHQFNETAHPSKYGSLDMYEIVKAMYDVGFDGYVRPDHGRMIWGETGRPGYGLYDRALGAVYLGGLWEAVCKNG
ncbi:MAG: mannonate dehydratase [Oscillospiraceae bacterium]|nr:mannonate dehydratase [Oscillospiraceae bacterium]